MDPERQRRAPTVASGAPASTAPSEAAQPSRAPVLPADMAMQLSMLTFGTGLEGDVVGLAGDHGRGGVGQTQRGPPRTPRPGSSSSTWWARDYRASPTTMACPTPKRAQTVGRCRRSRRRRSRRHGSARSCGPARWRPLRGRRPSRPPTPLRPRARPGPAAPPCRRWAPATGWPSASVRARGGRTTRLSSGVSRAIASVMRRLDRVRARRERIGTVRVGITPPPREARARPVAIEAPRRRRDRPLRTAPSIVAGQPVSVHAPARARFAMPVTGPRRRRREPGVPRKVASCSRVDDGVDDLRRRCARLRGTVAERSDDSVDQDLR